MPIRPENRDRYPVDWREISARIRFERAGGRCECRGECGVDHEAECGSFEPAAVVVAPRERGQAFHDSLHPVTGSLVVLTVAHPNHTPEHCEDDNLLALCQRCHNRLDLPERRRGRRARQRAKMADGDLFEDQG